MELCPECETKAYLSSMEMTPELAMEMAQNEPCPDYVGDEKYKMRLDICKGCSKLIGGMTCSNCGCFIQFRAKHFTAACSEGLW